MQKYNKLKFHSKHFKDKIGLANAKKEIMNKGKKERRIRM